MRAIPTLLMILGVAAGSGSAAADELDLLPLGGGELATQFGAVNAGGFLATASGRELSLAELAGELVKSRVVLIGESHTDIDQKRFHAALFEAMADLKPELALGMEFFLRSDQATLDAWISGEIDDSELLRATEWYDRGSYRFDYYRPVMEAARTRGLRVVGLNVPREILRAVNRGGLESLTDEQQAEVGDIATDGSAEHRYLVSRYFGETVALMPAGWFDNMYSAQCLWDVVMARSILSELRPGETMVVIVGSGHVAYGLGISRRIQDELAAAGRPPMAVATFCPVMAPPAPEPDDDPAGHPMGGEHGHGMGIAAKPARFTRTLADYVGAFPDTGGVEAYPRLGLQLTEEDDQISVSMAWPDTPAAAAGFESGDRILDLNGREPANLTELRAWLAATEWHQRVGFRIGRGAEDQEQEIAVLLYPDVDLTEEDVAPGWTVEEVTGPDPEQSAAVSALERSAPSRAVLVSRDGAPQWVEVRTGDVVDEVHEVDDDGRVVRSVYRAPRTDGAVEVRYLRAEDGAVLGTTRLDRTGAVLGS
jgi:uncharacterized iron-regulated protein